MSTTIELSELTGDYVLDTGHTRIGFIARHTLSTRVRGRFGEFEGTAHLDGDEPSKSSAQLTIQANSIDTDNPRRDDLLGRKFLGVDDHPTITFTLTRVEQFDSTSITVTGDLTMRGVTRPVTVDFELTGADIDEQGALRVGLTGSVTINRKDWGVHWKAAVGMVSPKVTLEFDVAVIRQS
ncbi:YceI family protein [Nocardia sp. CA-119907]|uniref:YceI family protein n=1 Tax=Nocardia sp. CA-119907 TaxID=3239973 RepID=UPI003D967225